MKLCALLTSVVISASIMSSCVNVDDAASLASTAADLSGYDLGFAKGKLDGIDGLSRTVERYSSLFSEADRAEFAKGYESGYDEGIKPGATADVPSTGGAAAYGQPLTVVNGSGTVTIMEGSKTVSVCKTALPNIEQTKFIVEQQQIVVKSRGGHGPATVQLFNTANGAVMGSVQAFDIKNGQPSWAAGMEE